MLIPAAIGVATTLVVAQLIDGRVAFFTGLGVSLAVLNWRRGQRAVADYVALPVAVALGLVAFFLLVQTNGWLGLIVGAAVTYVVDNWWSTRRGFARLAREQGLTPEQAEAVKRSMGKGREAVVQQMAAIQEEQRAALLAAGIDVTKIQPMIGREIKWLDIVRQVFRVLEFDRTDTTIVNDKVVDTRPGKPYGYLLVESPIMNQPVTIPIIHRDDFWLAASVFDDPQFAPLVSQDELLVTYAPRKILPNGFSGDISHPLHYVLAPQGTLARYYEVGGDLHMRQPTPEKLFGSFVYDGQIRVGLNRNPAI